MKIMHVRPLARSPVHSRRLLKAAILISQTAPPYLPPSSLASSGPFRSWLGHWPPAPVSSHFSILPPSEGAAMARSGLMRGDT